MKKLLLAMTLSLTNLSAFAGAIEHVAIVLTNTQGEVSIKEPVVTQTGEHRYHWRDLNVKETWNDQDFYHSMADHAFWTSGKSRKGVITKSTRGVTAVNREFFYLTNIEELHSSFGSLCADEIQSEVDKLESLLKTRPKVKQSTLIFKEKGKNYYKEENGILIAELRVKNCSSR